MKVVKEAIYMSIFGAGVCLASCGKDNSQKEETTESSYDSINAVERDGIETEMDSVVSRDTVMPAL